MNKPRYDRSKSFVGCTLTPDPDLSAKGWELRFIADPRMAGDAEETYSEVGYEVKLEPLSADDLKDECGACGIVFEQFKAVYTRKKGN
jgi:hypothetical protein